MEGGSDKDLLIQQLAAQVNGLQDELNKKNKDLMLLKAVLHIVSDDLQLKNEQFDLLYPNLSKTLAEPVDPGTEEKSPVRDYSRGGALMMQSDEDCEVDEEVKPAKENYFKKLPKHMQLFFIQYLDGPDLCKMACVCKEWTGLTQEPKLWKSLYYFSFRPRIIRDDEKVCWKDEYQTKYLTDRNWNNGRSNVMTLSGHNGSVTCLQYDDQKLISGSDDGSLFLWKIAGDSKKDSSEDPFRLVQQHHRQVRKIQRLNAFQGHGGPVWCLAFQDNTLVSGSYDKTVKIWNIRTAACRSTLRGHDDWVSAIQISGSRVVSGSWDASIKIWDIAANNGRGRCLATLAGAHGNAIYGLQWDDIGNKIVTGTRNNLAQIWDVQEQKLEMSLLGHENRVYCVQMDEAIVLTGSADKTIRKWDRRTGSQEASIVGHGSSVMTLQYDDSYRLVTGSYDNTLKTWDMRNFTEPINTLEGHSSGIFALQFDEDKIVSGSSDKTIRIWNFNETNMR
jgi:F-box/WD-40 domain protein 7